MTRVGASILLFLFSSFLLCMSVDFGLYLKMVNSGAPVDNVTSMPEEPHEDAGKIKSFFKDSVLPLSDYFSVGEDYFINQRFQLTEQIYFDVPFSPPEFA